MYTSKFLGYLIMRNRPFIPSLRLPPHQLQKSTQSRSVHASSACNWSKDNIGHTGEGEGEGEGGESKTKNTFQT